jgi:hypothetical protein
MEARDYSTSIGSILKYGTTKGTYENRLYGWLSIPAIGEEPNEIDTTTLDNEEFETAKYGLKPAVKMAIEFNMEDPNTEANINLVHNMAEANETYYFEITRPSGIKHEFASKVIYGYNEIGVNEIDKFTLYLAPIGEVETTVPSDTPSI